MIAASLGMVTRALCHSHGYTRAYCHCHLMGFNWGAMNFLGNTCGCFNRICTGCWVSWELSGVINFCLVIGESLLWWIWSIWFRWCHKRWVRCEKFIDFSRPERVIFNKLQLYCLFKAIYQNVKECAFFFLKISNCYLRPWW